MQQLLHDVRRTLRIFRDSPAFAVTVVCALTLGIGVNVAIFSVVDTVLLKPLPLPNPDTLVWPEKTRNGVPFGVSASPATFLFWRAQTDVFQDVAAFRSRAMDYTGGDTPEQLTAEQVSESFFRVYGGRIVRGRPFTGREDSPGGGNVAVISYRFWQQRLGGAVDVLGKTLPLNGDPYTIIGVASPKFDLRDFGDDPDLWVPLQLDPNSTSQIGYFGAGARLKPGVTLAEAKARIGASAAAFKKKYPGILGKSGGFTVLDLQQAIVLGNARLGLWVMLGAVGFVLLIACANVANLQLIRATERRREIAIRSTLGAGRGRIVRQLLTESVLLALLSGVSGLAGGFVGMRALLAVNTAGLLRLGTGGSLVRLDWRIAAFAVGLSLVAGALFGLAPALVGSRASLSTIIKDSGSRSGSGRGQQRTRSVLVAVEVGLAVVLVIGAALLIRTQIALTHVDPGFDPADTVVMRTSLSGKRFESTQRVAQTVRNVLERVRAIPGVAHAAATCCVPLRGSLGLPFDIEGRSHDKGSPTGGAGYATISPGYFKTFGIPVIRGRSFTASDDAGAPPVVIINEAMAKRFWSKGRNPLQARIVIGGGIVKTFDAEPVRQVVGIVGNVRANGLGNAPHPIMYEPIAQVPAAANAFITNATPLAWVVHTRVASAAVVNAVRNGIRQNTGLPVVNVQSMERVISLSTSRQRLDMLLMSIFGGAALLLAAIGIYGLIAYSMQQRRQEIGIRMALGAEPARVKGMVVRQGMRLVAIGIVAGLGVSLYMSKLLAALLFGVQPRDPVVFIAVPAVLALVAFVSVWVPAARASRVNPLDALRYE